jgi:hypothetical protein
MSNNVYKKSFLIRSLFAGLASWVFPLALFFALAFSQIGWGQTTLISPTGDGGFETGTSTALNARVVINGSLANSFAAISPCN